MLGGEHEGRARSGIPEGRTGRKARAAAVDSPGRS
jgi:hypothetical protein